MNSGPDASAPPIDWGCEWLLPINDAAPCGPSLEYDPDYAMLRSRMVPRAEAQYGDFIDLPGAPNWSDVERDCAQLLARTRDIHLLVWLCRARTRLAGATGLAQSLAVLAAVLARWPQAVHPQRVVEGEEDPTLRANAVAALADPEGLVADVREIVVHAGSGVRLTVRDIDRARHLSADALLRNSVEMQLSQARRMSGADPEAPLNRLASAARSLREIAQWCRVQLGGDAPELRPMARLLGCLGASDGAVSQDSPELRTSAVPAETASGVRPGPRDEALAAIRAARTWFEAHEPSSPVAVLLRQAERLIGKTFSEVVGAIPLDLLQKWETSK